MTILLETEFNIGDIVCHKTDTEQEEKFMVLAYYMMAVSENGEVIMYNVDCSNGNGQMRSFRSYEIERVEPVKKR